MLAVVASVVFSVSACRGDSGATADAGHSDAADPCHAEADYGSPTPTDVGALRMAQTQGFAIAGGLNQDVDKISVQLYRGWGVFTGGAVVPGSYEIAGDELNYRSCGLCVLLFTDSTAFFDLENVYFATGGQVVVSEVPGSDPGNLSVSATNLTFEHVTVDEADHARTTPVGDGCVSAITEIALEGAVE